MGLEEITSLVATGVAFIIILAWAFGLFRGKNGERSVAASIPLNVALLIAVVGFIPTVLKGGSPETITAWVAVLVITGASMAGFATRPGSKLNLGMRVLVVAGACVVFLAFINPFVTNLLQGVDATVTFTTATIVLLDLVILSLMIPFGLNQRAAAGRLINASQRIERFTIVEAGEFKQKTLQRMLTRDGYWKRAALIFGVFTAFFAVGALFPIPGRTQVVAEVLLFVVLTCAAITLFFGVVMRMVVGYRATYELAGLTQREYLDATAYTNTKIDSYANVLSRLSGGRSVRSLKVTSTSEITTVWTRLEHLRDIPFVVDTEFVERMEDAADPYMQTIYTTLRTLVRTDAHDELLAFTVFLHDDQARIIAETESGFVDIPTNVIEEALAKLA